MNSSINLVKVDARQDSKRKKRVYALKVISIVFLFFVTAVSIILFILSARISVDSIKKDEGVATQSLLLQKDKLVKIYLLNDRLKSIESVLKQRKNYTNTFNTLLDQIPAEVSTTSLSIDKGDIALTVNSASLLPINKFLNNIIDLSTKKKLIRTMTIESLTIDSKTGTYSLSIKAKII